MKNPLDISPVLLIIFMIAFSALFFAAFFAITTT